MLITASEPTDPLSESTHLDQVGMADLGLACSRVCSQLAGQLGSGWSRVASLVPLVLAGWAGVVWVTERVFSHRPTG